MTKYMTRFFAVTCLVGLVGCTTPNTQPTLQDTAQVTQTTIISEDLDLFVEIWQRSLTYVDYGTNEPFSFPVSLSVEQLDDTELMASFVYPDEPKANTKSTLATSSSGRVFNAGEVTTVSRLDGVLIFETIETGWDDNREAIIVHKYAVTL